MNTMAGANNLKQPRLLFLVACVCALLAIAALCVDRNAFIAAYLVAWWFWLGIALGGVANLFVYTLSGGRWGEAIAPFLRAAAAPLPLWAILFLPLFLTTNNLYGWHSADSAIDSTQRWWLDRNFFLARGVVYLLIWIALSRHLQRCSARHAAVGLIVYGVSISLAAVDWIMALTPQWHATGFGLLAVVGQLTAGMAFAIAAIGWSRAQPAASVFIDLGNLLLMYVLCWAYLAYTQFLIIWAGNLPGEINWYLMRDTQSWHGIAWLLGATHFMAPLVILLFRDNKTASCLAYLASALLLAHLLDCAWLILPSLADKIAPHMALSAALIPAQAIWMGALWWLCWRRALNKDQHPPHELPRGISHAR
ncbi:MAG TPA: hypothetical protein VGK97_01375 [Spongiibacteraceae bacterium]